jgi:hypothetical protein
MERVTLSHRVCVKAKKGSFHGGITVSDSMVANSAISFVEKKSMQPVCC